MNVKAGIVGFPNTGKSSLFFGITGKQVDIKNYAFCTIKPNRAIVAIPDERLEVLSREHNSKKIINSTMEIVDIAGLIAGASQGAGLGNQFLDNISHVDLVIHLVRCFENKNVEHVNKKIDPVEDYKIIEKELINWDMKILEKEKKHNREVNIEKYVLGLKKGIQLFDQLKNEEKKDIYINTFKKLALVTDKPRLICANIFNIEDDIVHLEKIEKYAQDNCLPFVVVNSEAYCLMATLTKEEVDIILPNLDLEKVSIDNLIKNVYKELGLVSFFTAGPEETRSWSIKKNTKAVDASGEIHTSFPKGFIKAEVLSFNNFLKKKNATTEGKDYIVQDGDIIFFRIANI